MVKRFRIPPDNEVLTTIDGTPNTKFKENLVKVLIWNVKKGRERGWQKDFKKLFSNCDLVLLQEAYLDDKMRNALDGQQHLHWVMAASFQYAKKGNIPTGVANGANPQPDSVIWKRSQDRERLINTPKMALLTRYSFAGSEKKLLVINIHGLNWASPKKFGRHLKDIETEIIKHDGPVLFGGDFNDRNKRRSKPLSKVTERNNLTKVVWENDHRRRNKQIDHAFIRGLEVKNARILTEIKSSDHPPLELEISLQD